MLDSWITLFNEKIVPTSAQYGVKVIGAWANRPQNEFIWVRTFASDDTLKTYAATTGGVYTVQNPMDNATQTVTVSLPGRITIP